MIKIFCDDNLIYDARDKELLVENPKITLETNKAGKLTFAVPPTNIHIDKLEGFNNTIKLYNNDELEFYGRILEIRDSFNNKKQVTCEGELAFLCDTQQRLKVYQCSPLQFFTSIINEHNRQVSNDKQFKVGVVSVFDNNNYIYRHTNFEKTLDVINEKLIKTLGGYINVRYDKNGNRYIDYLDSLGSTSNQIIEFGENLLDLDKYIKMSELKTAMIPLGAELNEEVKTETEENIRKHLTIESLADATDGDIVKKGDIIYSKSGVAKYGYIYAEKDDSTWNDVTLANNLLTKAKNKLKNMLVPVATLELNAIDLNIIDVDISKFKIGDEVRVLSKPNKLDKYFKVTKIEKDYSNPSKTKITLGATLPSLTATSNRTTSNMKETIEKTANELQNAKELASQQIKQAMGGYVYKTENELYIMDTNSLETAKKVWRWNLNGLGYSKNGVDGNYELAITQDGSIVADFITAGVLKGIKIIASTGQIGGITITSSGISSSGSNSNEGFGLWKTGAHKIDNTYVIFHAGGNNANIGGANFRVLQNGVVYASQLNIISNKNDGTGIHIQGQVPFLDLKANNSSDYTTRIIDYGDQLIIASNSDLTIANKDNTLWRGIRCNRIYFDSTNTLIFEDDGAILLGADQGISCVNGSNTDFTSMNASEYKFLGSTIMIRANGDNRWIVSRANGGFRSVTEDGNAFAEVRASEFAKQSSRRYKENIKNLSEEEANKLLELNVVTFDYKKDSMMKGKNIAGLIAEDVYKILPNTVTTVKIENEEVADAIDYSNFVPYLIKQVQLLNSKVEELEKKLNEINNK